MLLNLKILLLEDDPYDARLIIREIARASGTSETVTAINKIEYIHALKTFTPDIILSDHSLPSLSSVEALRLAIEMFGKIPFILVTGTMTEVFAVEIMRMGAWDYVPKNNLERLWDSIKKAMSLYDQEKLRQNYLFDLIRNESYMEEAERIANYGSWEFDLSYNRLVLSKEAHKILGYTKSEADLLKDNFIDIIHPDDQLRARQLIHNVLNEREFIFCSEKFRIADKGGSFRKIKIEFVIKHNSFGKPVKINGFIQNVTNSEPLEEQLYESEKRFSGLSESLESVAVFTLTAEGLIISSNKKAKLVFGYGDEDLSKKHLSQLFLKTEDSNDTLAAFITNTTNGKLKIAGLFKSKIGATIKGDVIVTGLKNQGGAVSGYLLVIENITWQAEHPTLTTKSVSN